MLILRGGRVLDPSQGLDEVADVIIDGGKIIGLGRNHAAQLGSGADAEVVNCTDRWVMPGFLDLRTHLGEPGQEYKEDIRSGLAAAAAGGFVGICAMPDTQPVNDSRATTELMLQTAASLHGSRLHLFAAMTRGLAGRELTEMAELREAGVVGVTDGDRSLADASLMRSVMEYAHTYDLVVAHHCQDPSLTVGAQMHEGAISTRLGLRGSPREAEDLMLARDLALVELTGVRYHMAHASSRGSVRLLREAKQRGLHVTAEVSPLHLCLSEAAMVGFDPNLKLNPPLRSEEDRDSLRQALADGTIDCVATSHRAQSPVEKDCEFDAAEPGAIGLETALPLLLNLVREEILSPLRMVECLSTVPCSIIGVAGGNLRQGAAADITVVDPNLRWTLQTSELRSKSCNTPLLGHSMLGAAVLTLVEGRVAFER